MSVNHVCRNFSCPTCRRIAITTAITAVPGQALASDFYALIVVFIAFGIAGVLVVQALIGIVLVIDKRYVSRDPALFISVAVVVLLIGAVIVLDEAAHLSAEDLVILFAAMLVPGAIAILPPLIQRARSRR